MSWARLDDAMCEHRKTRKVLRHGGLRGLAAFGLHTLGILHASKYMTDGTLTEDFTEDVFDTAKVKPRDHDLPEILVSAGLWTPGDNGVWNIHDYLKYNPSRDTAVARREAEAARKAAQRAAVST